MSKLQIFASTHIKSTGNEPPPSANPFEANMPLRRLAMLTHHHHLIVNTRVVRVLDCSRDLHQQKKRTKSISRVQIEQEKQNPQTETLAQRSLATSTHH